MPKNGFITSCILIVLLSSCKSLQNLASRDNSTERRIPAGNSQKDIQFLDNIAVTPGAQSGSKMIAVKSKKNEPKTEAPVINTDQDLLSYDPANLNTLRYKYAMMLNTDAGKLNNLLLLQDIDRWWGTKYCMGGSTSECIDCSAFSQLMIRDVYGVNIPRTAQEQFNSTYKIDNNNLSEGDLVFFHTSGNRKGSQITHVGVYITNNKFVHASAGGVTINDLGEQYWQLTYRGAGRVINRSLTSAH